MPLTTTVGSHTLQLLLENSSLAAASLLFLWERTRNSQSRNAVSRHCSLFGVFALILPFLSTASVFAGEPQWIEIRSPNFSVITDAGEKRGREVALHFEQMRSVYAALMTKANINLPVPLQIVAFRDTREIRQYAPLFNGKPVEVEGFFHQDIDRCFIMLDMSVENPWQVVFHEYAHQLLNGNLRVALDPWFEEGFAEYFSSIEVDSKQARVGKISRDEYRILQKTGIMKVADLFRVRQNSQTYNESGDHRDQFYAESDMLMHYIYDNRLMPQALAYFELRENRAMEVEKATQEAFGMSASQLDNALEMYIAVGHYQFYPISNPANTSSNAYIASALTGAAARAMLADIHAHSADYQTRAIAEFRDILQSDPTNAAACRGLGYVYLQEQNFSKAEDYLTRATGLDSKDPRVHYYNALLMARKSGFGDETDLSVMSRELEASIRLDPNFADSYRLLALAQSSSGHSAEALGTMRKALSISPLNERYRYYLADLFLINRQPEEAIAILQTLQVTNNPQLGDRVAQLLAEARKAKETFGQGAQ
jgi:tetratricopeptide (TPR) repeat protein